MNILYLIDPKSIHDQKWVGNFTTYNKFNCFFICRDQHFEKGAINVFQRDFNIKFQGTIDYFSFIWIVKSFIQLRKIRKIIKINNIQLLHIYFAEPNALWVLFRSYIGIPILITCRGTDVLKTIPEHFTKKGLLNKVVAWAYKQAFNRADWVTVTSSNQRDSIKKFSDPKNISIIRTGVDLKKLYSNTKYNIPSEINKSFILFPRYIKPIYNHEFCIEAIAELPEDIKKRFQFVFVGKNSGDNTYQNKLIKSLSELKVNFLILSKQSQQEIWGLYSKAELIVMTPKSDGSPVSGMEAIALKKKLILGPLDYDEDIFCQENVYRIKRWDKYELSETIKEVLSVKVSDFQISNDYLNKIDNKSNMQKLHKIYNTLTQPY
ncbi:MAG: glycosyltransferase [Bacteroidota bacterium]